LAASVPMLAETVNVAVLVPPPVTDNQLPPEVVVAVAENTGLPVPEFVRLMVPVAGLAAPPTVPVKFKEAGLAAICGALVNIRVTETRTGELVALAELTAIVPV
jgi:hypothetical protein